MQWPLKGECPALRRPVDLIHHLLHILEPGGLHLGCSLVSIALLVPGVGGIEGSFLVLRGRSASSRETRGMMSTQEGLKAQADVRGGYNYGRALLQGAQSLAVDSPLALAARAARGLMLSSCSMRAWSSSCFLISRVLHGQTKQLKTMLTKLWLLRPQTFKQRWPGRERRIRAKTDVSQVYKAARTLSKTATRVRAPMSPRTLEPVHRNRRPSFVRAVVQCQISCSPAEGWSFLLSAPYLRRAATRP